MTFKDEAMWPAATDHMINSANPSNPLLQPDNQHTTLMACIIPLPPHLAPVFIKNANSMLLNLNQILKTMHDTTSPHIQQMCTLSVQFLCTATVAMAPTIGPLARQLAIPLQPINMDQTLM